MSGIISAFVVMCFVVWLIEKIVRWLRGASGGAAKRCDVVTCKHHAPLPMNKKLLLLCVLTLPVRLGAEPALPSKPNVILVVTDDQGFGDVGVHGNDKIRTPHLDRFARKGIRLTRFYCQPLCSPTRAGLMTGRYHYRTGVIHTSRGGAKMHGSEVTIAELLSQAGYATAIFGKWHLGNNYPMRPQDQGFREVLIHRSGAPGQPPDHGNGYFDSLLWHNGVQIRAEGYCADVFTDAAIQFIEASRNTPFFVYLSTSAPHTPLEIDEKYVQPYRERGLNEDTARVYGMLENMDDNLGRLLTRLDQLGLRDNTLVVFLSDNGLAQERYNAGLRGLKTWAYEGGIRVPCFVQWPQALEGRKEIDQIAAHVDFFPTILDVCQVDSPENVKLDGTSLLPFWRGQRVVDQNRKVFIQCHRGLEPQRYINCAVVTQSYKLVINPGTFGRRRLDSAQVPKIELYDLRSDLAEKHDLSKERLRTVARLKAAYDRWFAVETSPRVEPGVIHLGEGAEDPALLSRYQDGTYQDGYSRGWSVKLTAGRYDLSVKQREGTPRGRVFVSWLGRTESRPAAASGGAVFDLREGKGLLDVWGQIDGETRKRIGDSSAIGDVMVRRLE